MLNQKTVIYIILSAILLYLYSKRGGIILFAAFVVVTVGTLFASAGAGAREGMEDDDKKKKSNDKKKSSDEKKKSEDKKKKSEDKKKNSEDKKKKSEDKKTREETTD